ncbi:MAG TPA: sugar transferase [Gemmataceae bacterium]
MTRPNSHPTLNRGPQARSRPPLPAGAFPTPVRPNLLARSPFELRQTLRLRAALEKVLAAVLLVATAPVLLACLLLVRCTSRGPALYRQQRVGRLGRVFTIYKIRTMYHECESFTGPRWSTPGDPRVTGVGKVLRALHLDELPQLVNVLRGEMSLIGPRPERPEIAEKLKQAIDGYDARVVLKPGVSGFAQVHLPPDSNLTSVRNKLALDLYYLRRFSVWFDLKIMACTGLKMFGLFRKKGLAALPAEPEAVV